MFLRKFNGVSSFFMIFLGFALLFIKISKKKSKNHKIIIKKSFKKNIK